MLGLGAVVVVVVVGVVVVVVGAGSPVSRNLTVPGSSVMLVTRSLLSTALTLCTRSDPSLNMQLAQFLFTRTFMVKRRFYVC